MNRMRHPHEELIDMVWSSGGLRSDTLPVKIRSHLSECEECRKFLEELKTVRRLAEALPQPQNASLDRVETAVASAMRSAELPRHTLRETGRASPVPLKSPSLQMAESLSPREKGGFALMVLGILMVHACLLKVLRPSGFLTLQGAVNWLSPFAFYAVFRTRQKEHRKREEVTE